MRPSITVLLAFGVVGCGGAQRAPTTPTRTIDLEPMRIEAERQPDGTTRVVAYDAASLLEDGNAALDRGRPRDALANYDRLLERFRDSELSLDALFDAGVAHERLGELEPALRNYATVVLAGELKGASAKLRVVAIESRDQRRDAALVEVDQLLAGPDLDVRLRIEALARKAELLRERGDDAPATAALAAAVALLDQSIGHVDLHATDAAARVRFLQAAGTHREFTTQLLRAPESELQEDVQAKLLLLQSAEQAYAEVVRVGNRWWTAASAIEVASLYEEMAHALVAAEVPAELPPDAAAVYVTEVAAYGVRYLERARDTYAGVVRADRAGPPTGWDAFASRRIAAIEAAIARHRAGDQGALAGSTLERPPVPSTLAAPPERWAAPGEL